MMLRYFFFLAVCLAAPQSYAMQRFGELQEPRPIYVQHPLVPPLSTQPKPAVLLPHILGAGEAHPLPPCSPAKRGAGDVGFAIPKLRLAGIAPAPDESPEDRPPPPVPRTLLPTGPLPSLPAGYVAAGSSLAAARVLGSNTSERKRHWEGEDLAMASFAHRPFQGSRPPQ